MATIAEFWDGRADLEEEAGTQDLIAKQLEVEAIAKYVKDGMRVLDAGCGNGLTALEFVRRYDIELVGIDTSEKMIEAAVAQLAVRRPQRGLVSFRVGNVCQPPLLGAFDLVYTERTLVNIPEAIDRNQAMHALCNCLAFGGLYVMCENSQEGVDRLNRLRVPLGLPEITPPWHNSYLTADDIAGFQQVVRDGLATLEGIDDYSSTYYYLSRVVNAALAAERGEEPAYDDPINQLALRLPPMDFPGQGRIWLWRRAA